MQTFGAIYKNDSQKVPYWLFEISCADDPNRDLAKAKAVAAASIDEGDSIYFLVGGLEFGGQITAYAGCAFYPNRRECCYNAGVSERIRLGRDQPRHRSRA
jgi:hypothetical protein